MALKDELVPLNAFSGAFSFNIDLIYAAGARKDNVFPYLYSIRSDTLWVHERLAPALLVATELARNVGWTLEFKDCLRPVEAQERMASYGYDPVLVSKPGEGAHPRAMAVDIVPVGPHEKPVEMGTPFDLLVDAAALASGANPAARGYEGSWTGDASADAAIRANRQRLEGILAEAGRRCGEVIVPYPEEWWDFRFPEAQWSALPALRQADLHDFQHLVGEDAMSWDEVRFRLTPEIRANIERTRATALEALCRR